MTAIEIPAQELMALATLLGRLDYGDHEDEVDPSDRNLEAHRILHSLVARGWQAPTQGGSTVIVRVQGEDIEMPDGSTADYLDRVYATCPWPGIPPMGTTVDAAGSFCDIDHIQLDSDGSVMIWLVFTEVFTRERVREFLDAGWQPSRA